jgi:hypothetical protein
MSPLPRTRRLHRLVGFTFFLLYVERHAVEPPPGCCAAVLARLQAKADPLDELYMDVLLAEANQLIQPR